jgi:hypothetical protein
MSIFDGFKFNTASKVPESMRERVGNIILGGVKEGLTGSAIKGALTQEGLGYWAVNMNYDIRRMGALLRVDPEASISANRALQFFDTVIEPYRKTLSTRWGRSATAQEAWGEYHRYKQLEKQAVEDMKQLQQDAIDFGFDDTPIGTW